MRAEGFDQRTLARTRDACDANASGTTRVRSGLAQDRPRDSGVIRVNALHQRNRLTQRPPVAAH